MRNAPLDKNRTCMLEFHMLSCHLCHVMFTDFDRDVFVMRSHLEVVGIHTECEGVQLTELAHGAGEIIDVFHGHAYGCHDDSSVLLYFRGFSIQISPPVWEVGLGLRVGNQHPKEYKTHTIQNELWQWYNSKVGFNYTWISYLPRASAPSSLAFGSALAHRALTRALSFAERLMAAFAFQRFRENMDQKKLWRRVLSKSLYIKPNSATPVDQIQTTPPIKKLRDVFIASLYLIKKVKVTTPY